MSFLSKIPEKLGCIIVSLFLILMIAIVFSIVGFFITYEAL